jgi:hypothetical protein
MNKPDIYYKKNKNDKVFNFLNNNGFENTQNYIPIYNKFFQLNDTNWNSINLNNKNYIKSFESKINDNIYKFYNQKDKLLTTFFKLSPLVDPVKYMVGKFKNQNDEEFYKLPAFNITTNDKKDCYNNTSYVDSFFYFLSSQLKNDYGFIHSTDFYGSFLTIKKDYVYNIFDDVEYLEQSSFFSNNCGKLFDVETKFKDIFINNDTRKNKQVLTIVDNNETEDELLFDCIDELNLDNIFFASNENTTENTNELNETYSKDISNNNVSCNSSNSSNSSLSSSNLSHSSQSNNTSLSSQQSTSCGSVSDSDSDSDSASASASSSISLDDEVINVTIKKFPVQIISIENMEHTLDEYISKYEVSDDELSSILFQVIMILITYQKVFDFTHNDLHTNNIMFNRTEQEFLYYLFKGKYYKVPTYGKIFKIIDFGRSIYRYNGKLMCSDSYDLKSGDAATQYNFEPYYNKNKPRVEPNKAFDLCRLACSLYDHFIDEPSDLKNIKKNSVAELIIDWVKDRQDRNILYKSNGKERYEGFKLYKMIARDVYKQTPEAQLSKPIFKKFLTQRRHIKLNEYFMNIDKYKPLV